MKIRIEVISADGDVRRFNVDRLAHGGAGGKLITVYSPEDTTQCTRYYVAQKLDTPVKGVPLYRVQELVTDADHPDMIYDAYKISEDRLSHG